MLKNTNEILFDEILNLKNLKYSKYRNYPNQTSLKKIFRKLPAYLKNRYFFSNYDFSNEKLNVEKSKYDLIAQREEIFFNKKPLPELYYKDEVCLIPKNTDVLFTYWEIKDETFENILKKHSLTSDNPTIIVKTLNNIEKLRIPTHSRIGSAYIHVESNNDYIAVLGFVDTDNNFIEVAISKEANVPNPLPSNNFEVKWGISEIKEFNGISNLEFKTLSNDEFIDFKEYSEELLETNLNRDYEYLVYEHIKYIGASETELIKQRDKLGSSNINK